MAGHAFSHSSAVWTMWTLRGSKTSLDRACNGPFDRLTTRCFRDRLLQNHTMASDDTVPETNSTQILVNDGREEILLHIHVTLAFNNLEAASLY